MKTENCEEKILTIILDEFRRADIALPIERYYFLKNAIGDEIKRQTIFWKEEKISQELQAELKTLVQRLVAQRGCSLDEMDRYEELLRELYLRGEEPETILKPK